MTEENQGQEIHYHAAVMHSRLQEGITTTEDNIQDPNIKYGPGVCFFMPAYRGKSSIDSAKFAEYLRTVSSGENMNPDFVVTNPLDVKYQDRYLPGSSEGGPENDMAAELINEIMTATANWTGRRVFPASLPWTIAHGYQHQTYPHSHTPDPRDIKPGIDWYACVYWAKVPSNSGLLELYPLGMEGTSPATVHVAPKEGDFFIFPANLMHGVRQNANKDELRISFSFNMKTVDPAIDIPGSHEV